MNIETARRLFAYDPASGVIVWRVDNGKSVYAGDRAGCIDTHSGYRKIRYRDRSYAEHRIAWMIYYGEVAPPQIDHINRVRDDNRIANLRSATVAENAFNKSISSINSSGVPGVYWSSEHKKWKAQISVRGRRHFLGLHDRIADAKAARSNAEIQYFGAFRPANTNDNLRDAA
ncbi:HNH endonuclease [Rhizobium sp. 11_C7_N12_5]|uniref:HNH endonuclease n=1 Tax=Rhizobium sp. 11_C7_N12_5 TaxID=3240770 RepID=UPI003F22C54F